MKTNNLNPQQLNNYYEHKEVISNRLQWVAIVTVISGIIAIALILEKVAISAY